MVTNRGSEISKFELDPLYWLSSVMCFCERVGEYNVHRPPCAPPLAYVGEGTVGPLTLPVPPRARHSAYARSMSLGDITFAGVGCIDIKTGMEEATSGARAVSRGRDGRESCKLRTSGSSSPSASGEGSPVRATAVRELSQGAEKMGGQDIRRRAGMTASALGWEVVSSPAKRACISSTLRVGGPLVCVGDKLSSCSGLGVEDWETSHLQSGTGGTIPVWYARRLSELGRTSGAKNTRSTRSARI